MEVNLSPMKTPKTQTKTMRKLKQILFNVKNKKRNPKLNKILL